ncbi:MAG: LytR C-terminal domain-containing protein [Actinobacteria bacterium]|nr:LytR C-terminal domain-containing protein [Actinomycetota bacterium]
MGELKDILVNVGSIAGVAAIVGLAVLAMLYFSQARDVRRLREWAGREPERAAEVELRAAQIASQAIAQAYESMALRQSEADAAAEIAREQGVEVDDLVVAFEPPPSIETAEHPEPVVSGMEGAADDPEHVADVAAGADAAEDEQHPEPVVTGMEGAADDPEHMQELAASAVGNGRPAGEADAESGAVDLTVPAPDLPVEDAEEATQLAESVAADAVVAEASAETAEAPDRAASIAPPVTAGATGEIRPSRLAPSTPAATRGQIPLPPLPPLDTSEFLAVNRPVPTVPSDYQSLAESAGTGGFESGGRPPERRSGRMPVIIAGVLVAVFAVTLVATQLGGSSGDKATTDVSARRQARDKKEVSTSERDPQVNRPAVTVSVLNGTQTAGLASLVKEQLVSAGFTSTTSGNRNDSVNHATSTVYYASGNKLEAKEVARELAIDDVKEIDEDTQTAGGSAPVVVVLGADIEQ